MTAALHAIRRFGFGASPAELQAIDDPRSWLSKQVDDRRAASMPASSATMWQLAAIFEDARMAKKAGDDAAIKSARRQSRDMLVGEIQQMLQHRIHSRTPFVERLVAFWSNHLCVSLAGKPNLGPMVAWYERDAIRPHVLGNFEDMVLASAQHPAMLTYLDNAVSIGPNSNGAKRAQSRGRNRGLNENYARELLELHTVGVDGPYDQQDVEQLARILTGWSLRGMRGANSQDAPGFVFREQLHEPGSKTLLGKHYPETGEAEGIEAIRDLCQHPATARFVATKLAQHFVSDAPPESAIQRIEQVFVSTRGDLREVARALIGLDEAWESESVKFRSPQDWIISVLRIAPPQEVPKQVVGAMRKLRHPVWAPGSPKGFGDKLTDWADPDSLMNRAELARQLARKLRRDGWRADELLTLLPQQRQAELQAVLGGDLSSRDQVALLVGGPAFQWR